jgi:hypothetical protein
MAWQLFLGQVAGRAALNGASEEFPEPDPFTFIGAVAILSGDQAIADSTDTAITWNGVDVIDTDAIHDPSSANTRMTIPAGLDGTLVIVWACFRAGWGSNAGSGVQISIRKNGSASFDGAASVLHQGLTFSTFVDSTIQTQPIMVATGDYFEVFADTTESSQSIESDYSSMGLWVIG